MKGKKPQEAGSDNGKRKHWSAKEKLRIVLTGMEPGVEISDLCRREGVNPAQCCQWKRQVVGSSERIFERKESQPSAREERLAKDLGRANDAPSLAATPS